MRKELTQLKNPSLSGVYTTTKNKVVPTKLNKVWKNAVCLAVFELPNAAIQEVAHVPIFAPTTKHNALSIGKRAPETKKTTIDVTTDDDWTTKVNANAIKIRRIGLVVELKIAFISSLNDSFSMFAESNCKPINKTPKPATISPKIFKPFFLERRGIAPTNDKKAKYGVKLKADKETINVVIVVPILAPIIQAQAWNNVIVPISANLTKVTAVTSDDWTIAQCNIPEKTPPTLFLALKLLEKNESLLREAWTKPFDIKLMPTKKQPHAVKTSMIPFNVLENDEATIWDNIKCYYFPSIFSTTAASTASPIVFFSFFASPKASATTCAPVMKSERSLGIKTLFAGPLETCSSVS